MSDFYQEIKNKERFKFGSNWASFLSKLNQKKIDSSKKALLNFMQVESLVGKTFLDVGSGSGLSSLSARNSGAEVFSFDFDPQSVTCTRFLKEKFFSDDQSWTVQQGSAIDDEYMNSLKTFDIVYSWGVLHHTGKMYKGLQLIESKVKKGGLLFIALYSDQGLSSKIWLMIKKLYVKSPFLIKKIIVALCFIRLWTPPILIDFIKLKPFSSWQNAKKRGMSPYHDVIDWVGGYPFEVSTPEEIIHFYIDKGYELKRLKTCKGGHGCNEFLFKKK